MLALVTAFSLITITPLAAPPPGVCPNAPPARQVISQQPWAQQVLDPKTVWEHSTGSDVLVAVVDSGVDGDHPQLEGRVLPGQDFQLVGDLPGDFDCASHGTSVASIIAARPANGVGFAGLAPDARVLPVRVVDRNLDGNGNTTPIDPVVLARGIWYAVDQGAKVINLSLAGGTDNQYMRDAVAHAVAKDVVVVAAVGNHQQGTDPGPTTFPAGYDGVLGVGAIDNAGQRLQDSGIGPQVDIVAPGGGVTAAARVGGHDVVNGTSFAAPFVSATAALVRAAWPKLSAPEVAARILATATPAPGGAGGAAYGVGVVNPYRAVTDGLSAAKPLPQPEIAPVREDPERQRVAAWWAGTTLRARLSAGGAAAVTLLGFLAAVVLSRGRRARWLVRRTRPGAVAGDELPEQIYLMH